MRKINKKTLGAAALAVMMVFGAVGCEKLASETTEAATEAEATTEATTAAATESTSISQRAVEAGEYTDVSKSYTITLPKGKWKTIDETLEKTSISSKKDLIEITNITKEEEVKQTLKDIPTLKKSFEGYAEKLKENNVLLEEAELVGSKFKKKSETVGEWYYTFKIKDEVYNYVVYTATFTNDHVVMATGYTEGGKSDRKALQEALRSIKLIEEK